MTGPEFVQPVAAAKPTRARSTFTRAGETSSKAEPSKARKTKPEFVAGQIVAGRNLLEALPGGAWIVEDIAGDQRVLGPVKLRRLANLEAAAAGR